MQEISSLSAYDNALIYEKFLSETDASFPYHERLLYHSVFEDDGSPGGQLALEDELFFRERFGFQSVRVFIPGTILPFFRLAEELLRDIRQIIQEVEAMSEEEAADLTAKYGNGYSIDNPVENLNQSTFASIADDSDSPEDNGDIVFIDGEAEENDEPRNIRDEYSEAEQYWNNSN